MDLLDSMKVYVLTVEKGSLSAAADACAMSATMAGNHVRALEERLGMQLMHRTTRRQHVTAFGEDYYARCKEILRLVAETDAQAHAMRLAPAGTLRVSAPVTFGVEALAPALPDYLARYPEVDVELDISDRVVDLMDGGCEAAIRIGQLAPDSSLVARPLAPYRLMLCASPAYLARRGMPDTPADLAHHDCLSFGAAGIAQWRFQRDHDVCQVPVQGRVKINNGQALRTAALQGLGVVLQPTILLEADVRAGRLVQLFPDFELPSRPVHVVYLPDRYRSPKLRSFIDFVVERFGEPTP
ncbi:LysR family transcriptional regulator [Massilia pinisoli]|uniref:LysR family transcriptional regulator n=1 Tax=Massilia pinisoli TaxID=1772194 RepID=A0ABT1ZLU6_9BURK|nr:LysR family transcriptional regulator [Massilia pinisoli]MCS0580858.1 LysR family transcriptional regulator [Massilia pinisoli]